MSKLPFNPIIWPAVPHDFTGDLNLGYYATELTQRYTWGTRGMTWDGKVFKYGRAKGTVWAGFGAANAASVDVSDLINLNTVTIVAGDRSVLVTIDAAEGYNEDAIAEDELAGAQFVVGHGAAATTETRTVIGNDAVAAAGGAIRVYVDAPFALDHTAGFVEIPLNAYGYLTRPGGQVLSVMGIPNVIATTGQHVWIQTWGLCWCVPGGGDANIASEGPDRSAYFVEDGSVNGGDILDHIKWQKAGFVTDSSEAGIGAMPMVMLQISI